MTFAQLLLKWVHSRNVQPSCNCSLKLLSLCKNTKSALHSNDMHDLLVWPKRFDARYIDNELGDTNENTLVSFSKLSKLNTL